MQWKVTPLPTAHSYTGTDISDDTYYSCVDRMDSECPMERVLPASGSRSSSATGCDTPLNLLHLPDDALHHIFSFLSTDEKYGAWRVAHTSCEYEDVQHHPTTQVAKLSIGVQAHVQCPVLTITSME